MPIQKVLDCLQTWYHFPQQKVYCQVATVDADKPTLRTMELYAITAQSRMILCTKTDTRKWRLLTSNPHTALCIAHQDYGQILIEGKVELLSTLHGQDKLHPYWETLLDPYWKAFYNASDPHSSQDIPSSFGIIEVQPEFIEILALETNDYLKSQRTQYTKNENTWSSHYANLD